MSVSKAAGFSAFSARCEQEVRELAGLKALEVWNTKRHNEVWKPFHDEIRRLTEQGHDVTAADRDRIARETGVAALSQELQRVYEDAVRDFMGKAAEGLSDPNSESYREVVKKHDAAWKELAKK